MSEPIPKPKRRRWRWLALIVPALLILVVYLFDAPKKLDQRLVGRWGFQNNTSAYNFRADGSGRWSEFLDGSGRGHNFEWWIDGDFLVMETRHDAITNFTRKVENTTLRIARSVAPRQLLPSIWNPDHNEGHRFFYLARIEPQSIGFRRVKDATPDPTLKDIPDTGLEFFTRQSD
jgi:hypothetical protein